MPDHDDGVPQVSRGLAFGNNKTKMILQDVDEMRPGELRLP